MNKISFDGLSPDSFFWLLISSMLLRYRTAPESCVLIAWRSVYPLVSPSRSIISAGLLTSWICPGNRFCPVGGCPIYLLTYCYCWQVSTVARSVPIPLSKKIARETRSASSEYMADKCGDLWEMGRRRNSERLLGRVSPWFSFLCAFLYTLRETGCQNISKRSLQITSEDSVRSTKLLLFAHLRRDGSRSFADCQRVFASGSISKKTAAW